ncbi:RsmD family RNA methyltransferase [Galliscardovia ingluviei]|nr:RsmD family RNA methyltransferase [Galliscardovia ingluviei]
MRIISGRFKGFEVRVPAKGTRPTTDRTKEAVFSHLESMGMLDNTRILDLYAGSGALGIEALSRGAHSLVAVEMASQAANILRTTFAQLRKHASWQPHDSAQVVKGKAEQFPQMYAVNFGGDGADEKTDSHLVVHANKADKANKANKQVNEQTNKSAGSQTNQPFDVVFIDPPYAVSDEVCNALLADLVQCGVVDRYSVIIVERSARSPKPQEPQGWEITRAKDYGETAVYTLEAVENAAATNVE